jgi:AraC-like DNA-binding protein
MKLNRDVKIFLDANVIIEANRTNIWKALLGQFNNLGTVTKIVEELNTGDQDDPAYVKIDTTEINSQLSPQNVSPKEIIELKLRLDNEIALDSGEEELLAHICSKNEEFKVFYVCSPDKACIKAAKKLGFIDNVLSLESLASKAGVSIKNLQFQFTEKWLTCFKTQLILEDF